MGRSKRSAPFAAYLRCAATWTATHAAQKAFKERVPFTHAGGSDYAERDNSELTDESGRSAACGITRHTTFWVKPSLVGQFEFVEWTPDNHLRRSRFVGLREDTDPQTVRRD